MRISIAIKIEGAKGMLRFLDSPAQIRPIAIARITILSHCWKLFVTKIITMSSFTSPIPMNSCEVAANMIAKDVRQSTCTFRLKKRLLAKNRSDTSKEKNIAIHKLFGIRRLLKSTMDIGNPKNIVIKDRHIV